MRALTLALLVPLAACGNGSSAEEVPGVAGKGTGDSRSFAVADFARITQAGPDDVDVRVGSGFSVRAEGNEKALAKLRIARDGDMLRIERERGSGLNWNNGGKVKVYVTMPRITALSLTGAGDATIDRIEGASFDGEIAGAGDMSIGTMAVEAATFSIVGAGNLTASGTATTLKASTTGAGDIDASGLTAKSATVDTTGAGNVRAVVDGAAKVSVMGAGDVDLGPKARCTVSKMGPGEVTCGG